MPLNDVIQDRGQYLTFLVADEEYAVNILQVTEIIECVAMTKVPTTPPWIRGVLNLRGAVVPVVDLAVKFGLPETPITRRTCVIMVEANIRKERLVMGVMADSVNQVVELGGDDIQPPPAFGPRIRVDHLLGLGRTRDKFALILNIDRVLGADEILAVSAAAGAAVAAAGAAVA